MKHRLGYIRSLLVIGLTLLFTSSSCIQNSTQEAQPPTATLNSSKSNTATPINPRSLSIHLLSEQGKFEVTFPNPEATQTLMEYTVTKQTFGKAMECNLTLARDNGAIWLVQYCDYSAESLTGLSTKEILDRGSNEALLDARARLISESDITMNQTILGRALIGEADMRGMGYDGTYKTRLYLAGNRLYTIAASVYNENWGNRMELIDPFLNSFTIEPDLTIPYEPTP